ncbi:MAG: hypothetical protein KAH32_01535 [Chlamydiia bacterium]|nr:hypothetical protein [Chlamydiia bacterium]
MNLEEFTEDFKYFVGFGMCASAKYFAPYGMSMIKAARTIKINKYTEIARAVASISEFKIKDAREILEGLSIKHPNDEEIESLLTFVRTITLKVFSEQDISMHTTNKQHNAVRKTVKKNLEKLAESNNDFISDLAETCQKSI